MIRRLPGRDRPIEYRARRVLVLLVALGLGGCGDRNRASRASALEKPVKVAAILAACNDLEDCNRQCGEASPASCVSAGRLYEFGHGVAADASRAFRLYEQACDLKSAGGCYNAAVLLEAGRGVERNPGRAHELYTKVCAMGSKTSCERATLGGGGTP